ncbi:MAG: DNA replication and repair protein RecF [Lysobacterales bacterium]|nr:MAG: DNA replication and repair protein RecF [Xanthomonadales bacterium]
MRILSASVTNFRNLADATLDFSPRVNLLLGRNGEGKTNLLEALNWFALGRSHRGGRSDELIAFGQEALHVSLSAEEDSGAVVACEYGLDRSGGRRLRVDVQPLKARADLIGRLVTVVFNPDTIGLVRGAPQMRRQFADQGMAELDPAYLGHLSACLRALKQKAGLLHDLRRGFSANGRGRAELTAWNRELALHSAAVCRGRAAYASLLEPPLQVNHEALAGPLGTLSCDYRPRLESVVRHLKAGGGELPPEEELAGAIFTEIDYIMETEIRRGRPLTGPQFDDFNLVLEGVDLRVYGSQGQTRTAAIAMILARSDVLFGQRRMRPVLFFDDIFSELDRERTRRLQEMSSREHQVFVATARTDDIAGWRPEGLGAWRVEGGRFTAIQATDIGTTGIGTIGDGAMDVDGTITAGD